MDFHEALLLLSERYGGAAQFSVVDDPDFGLLLTCDDPEVPDYIVRGDNVEPR